MKTDLLTVPGIGKNIKQDLIDIGIDCVEALRGQDPELLYQKDCEHKGRIEDRCQLYVLRCAVYYADQTARGKTPRPAEMPVVVLEGARLSFFGRHRIAFPLYSSSLEHPFLGDGSAPPTPSYFFILRGTSPLCTPQCEEGWRPPLRSTLMRALRPAPREFMRDW